MASRTRTERLANPAGYGGTGNFTPTAPKATDNPKEPLKETDTFTAAELGLDPTFPFLGQNPLPESWTGPEITQVVAFVEPWVFFYKIIKKFFDHP